MYLVVYVVQYKNGGVIWTNYFCIIVIVWAVKRDLYSLNNSIK